MRVLITDDEAPARARLRALVDEIGRHEVVAEAASGSDALALCERLQPDALLLDIRMPGIDGLETARHLAQLEHPPAVIFTTAYDQHAVEAFDASAVDYLLKPIRRERLEEALDKVQRLTRAQLAAVGAQAGQDRTRTHICARIRGNLRLIPVDEVLYFMADQKYVIVRHLRGEVLVEESLKSLEQEFGGRFLRIHRNALVAKAYLEGMERAAGGRLLVRLRHVEEGLEVSRRHAAEVRQNMKLKS
ncbi:MAG: LytTR family DNA-binding domain-containing protein [Gammaproteobacteria bacterium]